MGSVCREFCSLRNKCLENTLWGLLIALIIAFLLACLLFLSAGTGWLVNRYVTHGDSFFIEQHVGPAGKFFLLSFMGFITLALASAYACAIGYIFWKIYGCISVACRAACREARERAARDTVTYDQLEMVERKEEVK